MPVPAKLALGLVLLAWGFTDYLFPQTVIRIQSGLLNYPPEPKETLVRHKRRIGLICILAGTVALIITLG